MGGAAVLRAVDLEVIHGLPQPCAQAPALAVAACRGRRGGSARIVGSQLQQRLRQRRDAGEVLQTCPPAPLALVAGLQRSEAGTWRAHQRADAAATTELGPGQGEEVGSEPLDVHGQPAAGLARVDVQQRIGVPAQGGDLGQRLQRADFVVGVLHAHQSGALAQAGGEGVEVHAPVAVHGHAHVLQAGGVARSQHGGVLDGGGQDPRRSGAVGQGRAADREVHRLRASGGEHHALRRGGQLAGDGGPGGLQQICRSAPLTVGSGRVAGQLTGHLLRRPQRGRVPGGGGGMVQVGAAFRPGGGGRRGHPPQYRRRQLPDSRAPRTYHAPKRVRSMPMSVSTDHKSIQQVDTVTIRFAGDSGDGMQIAGDRFTSVTAQMGNDIATLPDFPAEIRAPAGSLPGVSGFQLHFADHDILTPGDAPNVLVAMNPAALKTNVHDVEAGGAVIVNSDAFTKGNLRKAKYDTDPLSDGSLERYQIFQVPLTTLTVGALQDTELGKKDKERCKNFFALGLMSWMYSRPTQSTIDWISEKFAKRPDLVAANITVFKAGYAFGETTELFTHAYRVKPAKLPEGRYRQITGNLALAYGLVAAAERSGLPLFMSGYPITPASDILHELSKHKNFGVRTLQAEDEIAAVGMALGASFAGNLAVTATSGPGVALKAETIGLAVSVELPLVIVNIQRGGPSTGLPTKTEQSDLLQALFGRNGEAPVPVVAADTPGGCFHAALEAAWK